VLKFNGGQTSIGLLAVGEANPATVNVAPPSSDL
jgi:hypothetical protein